MIRRLAVAVPSLLILVVILVIGCKVDRRTTNITSTSDYLSSLEIRVPTGFPVVPEVDVPLTCIAVFNETAEQDWSARVIWSVSDPTWATITSTGVLRVQRAGWGEVRAEGPEGWLAKTVLSSHELIDVSLAVENDILLNGEESHLEVNAAFDDGSQLVLSSLVPVTWWYTRPEVCHIVNGRTLHGDRTGQTAMTLRFGGMPSYPVIVTVDSVLSLTCRMLSAGPYLPLDTIQLGAFATTTVLGLLGMNDRVEWTSSDPLSLLHLRNGVYVSQQSGVFTAGARYGSISSPALNVEIWHVTSLAISPTEVLDTLDRGDSVRFTALAEIENHGEQNLTSRVEWISTLASAGVFAEPGLFVARRTGRTEIYARSAFTMSPHTVVNVFAPALLADGFESYPVGTFASNTLWDVWDDDGMTDVEIGTVGASGVKGCTLIDSMDYYTAGIANQSGYLNPIRRGNVEADMRPGPGMWLWVGGPSSSQAVAIIEFSYGEITVNQYTSVGTYSPDSWYHVRVEFDCVSDDFDLYINGELVDEGVQSYSGTSSINNIGIFSSPATYYGIGYIDNVWVDGEEVGSVATPNPGPVHATAVFDWSTPHASRQF